MNFTELVDSIQYDSQITEFAEALTKLSETGENVAWKEIHTYSSKNISFWKKYDENHISYEIALHNSADFIHNFEVQHPAHIEFAIGGNKWSSIDNFIYMKVFSPYTQVRMRCIIPNEYINDMTIFSVIFECGLLTQDVRYIATKGGFTHSHKYLEGVIYPISLYV